MATRKRTSNTDRGGYTRGRADKKKVTSNVKKPSTPRKHSVVPGEVSNPKIKEKANKARAAATKKKTSARVNAQAKRNARNVSDALTKATKKTMAKKAAAKVATKAVPFAGTAMAVKDVAKAVKRDAQIAKKTPGRPKGKGGQMKRGRRR